MKFTPVDLMLGRVKSGSPTAVVIWEDPEGRTNVAYCGMTPEEVVTLLYNMADEVMRQCIEPLEPRRAH